MVFMCLVPMWPFLAISKDAFSFELGAAVGAGQRRGKQGALAAGAFALLFGIDAAIQLAIHHIDLFDIFAQIALGQTTVLLEQGPHGHGY